MEGPPPPSAAGHQPPVFDPQPEGRVWTAFPLHDLGLIQGKGRLGQPFQLDSGSLRGMAMTVRRVVDALGRRAFDIDFEARAGSLEALRRKLLEKGAVEVPCAFPRTQLDPSGALVETQESSVLPGQALELVRDGRWRVRFVPFAPEALRGAVQLRVYGEDDAATRALRELITTLDLQAMFASPSPSAKRRWKLLRALWAARPHHLPPRRTPEQLRRAIDAALARLGITTEPEAQSPEDAALSALAFEHSPAWLIQSIGRGHKIERYVMADQLALSTEGVDRALAAGVAPARAEALARFAVLAKRAPGTARALVSRDVEALSPALLEAALTQSGLADDAGRVPGLSVEEVYPGYFTVYDPELAAEAEAAGAAYLYSTVGSVDRVYQILSEGQKSSLVRYREGLLISGLSSVEDFASGGARSVFSRLVTRAAIEQAETKPIAFNDWDGTRPYKVLLDRAVLGRTDWYGFVGDAYGDPRRIQPHSRGEAAVRRISQACDQDNEVMFPYGNAPRFIRGVVCQTEEQRQELIQFLRAQGLDQIGEHPLEEAIFASTKLFPLPEDRGATP